MKAGLGRTAVFMACLLGPAWGRADQCLDVVSSGCNDQDLTYFDNALSDPNTPPPPADGSGYQWWDPSYNHGAGWLAAQQQGINNGVAMVPVGRPRNTYCPFQATAGGGPDYADWIGPIFTGPTVPIPNATPPAQYGSFNNGDRWWSRHSFSLPTNAQVTSAVLSYSADNQAIPWVNGQALQGAPGPGLGWNVLYTYAVPLSDFVYGQGSNVIAWQVTNQDNGSSTGLTYDLALCYVVVSPTFTSTASPSSTATPTASPSTTPTDTPSDSPTATVSPSASPTKTPTTSPTDTLSATQTATFSSTASPTLTATPSPTATPIATLYPTPSTPGVPCLARSRAVIGNSPSGQVILDANARVDSYDSGLTTYAGTLPDGGVNISAHGDVQGAGTILVNGTITLLGNVYPKDPANLAVVPVPGSAKPMGALLLDAQNPTLSLAPGDYVFSSIQTQAGTSINLLPGGGVRIWVTGTLLLGGTINGDQIPRDLQILSTGTGDIDLNSQQSIFALVYAPLARVVVDSVLFGSAAGSEVYVNSHAQVHLDVESAAGCPVPPTPVVSLSVTPVVNPPLPPCPLNPITSTAATVSGVAPADACAGNNFYALTTSLDGSISQQGGGSPYFADAGFTAERVYSPASPAPALRAISSACVPGIPPASHAWAVGDGLTILYNASAVNLSAWQAVPTTDLVNQEADPASALTAVDSTNTDEVWAVGGVNGKGLVVKHQSGNPYGNGWTTVVRNKNGSSLPNLKAVKILPAGTFGACQTQEWVLAGGESPMHLGLFLSTDGNNFNATGPTLASGVTITALALLNTGSSQSQVWAVGTQGTILKGTINASCALVWTVVTGVPPVTTQDLYAVAAQGPNNIVAVGAHGTTISFNGVQWSGASLASSDEALMAVMPDQGSAVSFCGCNLAHNVVMVCPPTTLTPTPTFTSTATASDTPSLTPTPSFTNTFSASPTPSASATPTNTPAAPSPTPTSTPTDTPAPLSATYSPSPQPGGLTPGGSGCCPSGTVACPQCPGGILLGGGGGGMAGPGWGILYGSVVGDGSATCLYDPAACIGGSGGFSMMTCTDCGAQPVDWVGAANGYLAEYDSGSFLRINLPSATETIRSVHGLPGGGVIVGGDLGQVYIGLPTNGNCDGYVFTAQEGLAGKALHGMASVGGNAYAVGVDSQGNGVFMSAAVSVAPATLGAWVDRSAQLPQQPSPALNDVEVGPTGDLWVVGAQGTLLRQSSPPAGPLVQQVDPTYGVTIYPSNPPSNPAMQVPFSSIDLTGYYATHGWEFVFGTHGMVLVHPVGSSDPWIQVAGNYMTDQTIKAATFVSVDAGGYVNVRFVGAGGTILDWNSDTWASLTPELLEGYGNGNFVGICGDIICEANQSILLKLGPLPTTATPTPTPSSANGGNGTWTASPTLTPTVSPAITATPSATRTSSPTSGMTPTLSTTATATATRTATATATVTSTACAIKVQYQAMNNGPNSNTLQFSVNVVNLGSSPEPLDQVTLRYWFSEEGSDGLVATVDYAGLQPAGTNVTAQSTVAFNSWPQCGQTHYLQLGFVAGAGSIPVGGFANLQVRIHTASYQMLTQTNDYSFNGAQTSMADSQLIPAYCGGALAWGQEPHCASATTTASSTSSVTATLSVTTTRTATATVTATLRATSTVSSTPTVTVSPTPTATPSVTVTSSATGTFTATSSVTLTPTQTETVTATPSRTATSSATATYSATGTLTATSGVTMTSTPTPTATTTLTLTGTPSVTATSSATATVTATPSVTLTRTPTTTATSTSTLTATPSVTATSSATGTVTATSSVTLTPMPTTTATTTSTITGTPNVTATSSATGTSTATSSGTLTPTQTETVTTTPSQTATSRVTATSSATGTVTATSGVTMTSTPTQTAATTLTLTGTPSVTATSSATATVTATPSVTLTRTPTTTATTTPTLTATASVTATSSATGTLTASSSVTLTFTQTVTTTATPSVTATSSASVTLTGPGTGTITITPALTVTPTTVSCCLSLTATYPGFNIPASVAVAPDGSFFVIEVGTAGLPLVHMAADGTVLSLCPGGLVKPMFVVTLGTDLYVYDAGSSRIEVYDPGTCAHLSGWAVPTGLGGGLGLGGMTVGPGGNLYLAGAGPQLLEYDPLGNLIASLTVSSASGSIYGLSSDGTYLYAGVNTQTVAVLSATGGVLSTFGNVGTSVTFLGAISASPDGLLFISGFRFDGVQVWSRTGQLLCSYSLGNSGSDQFFGTALAPNGDLLLASSVNGTILRFSTCASSGVTPLATATATVTPSPSAIHLFTPTSTLTATLSVTATTSSEMTPVSSGTSSPSATPGCCLNYVSQFATGLSYPAGLTYGPDGTLYVGSQTTGVARFAADGTTLPPLGVGVLGNSLAVAVQGNRVYVLDNQNTRSVLVFDASSLVQVASWTPPADAFGMAFGADGNLYFSGYSSGLISRYLPAGTPDGSFPSGLVEPTGIMAQGPDLVVAGTQTKVGIYGTDGTTVALVDVSAGHPSPYVQTYSALVAPDGNLLTTGWNFGGIYKHDSAGNLVCATLAAGNPPAPFQSVTYGMALDSSGDLLVADNGAGIIWKFSFCGGGSVTPPATVTPSLTVSPTSSTTPTPTATPTATLSASPTPVLLACTPISGPGWPMTGHDARQSSIGDALGPTTYSVRWQVANSGFFAPVVDQADRVFAGTGTFAAYDAFGDPLWSFSGVGDLGNGHQSWAPLVTGVDQVFLHYHSDPLGNVMQGFSGLSGGRGLNFPVPNGYSEATGPIYWAGQAYFFGFNSGTQSAAYDLSTGLATWTLPSPDNGEGEGAIGADGTVYMVSSAGNLYSYSPPSVSPNWVAPLPAGFGSNLSVDSSGNVVVLLGTQVRAYDHTGSLLWSFSPALPAGEAAADIHIALSPDGGVYFVTIGGGGSSAYLTKVMPNGTSTPTVAWTTQIPGFLWCNTALCPFERRLVVDSAGTVFVPGNGVEAIDRNGNYLWSSASDLIWGMALSHDGTLYAQGGGTLYAIGGDPCGAGSGGATTIAGVAVKATATPAPYWASQLKGAEAVLAAPNPAGDKVQVAFRLNQAGHARLMVMDLLGNTVKTVDLGVLPAGDALRPVETRGLASGLYVLILVRDSGDGPQPVAHFKLAVLH